MMDRQERGARFRALNGDRKDLDFVVKKAPPGRRRVSTPWMQLMRRCLS
jgi:hypothetical protein